MLGGVILIIVLGIVGIFVGPEPAVTQGFLTRFPEVRRAHIFENGLYLAVLALWVIHILALHRTLRRAHPAPALIGSALAVLGLVMLAAGALPHIAQTPIADLYHAPGTGPEAQATLVLMWQATMGIFDALLVTGLLLIPFGYIGLGIAMRGAPRLRGVPAAVSVGLGAVGLVAALVVLVEFSAVAALGVLALILFHLVLGWKTFQMSRIP